MKPGLPTRQEQARHLKERIWKAEHSFEVLALDVFHFQRKYNPVYGEWVNRLGVSTINSINEIPFLPISFFKTHEVKSFEGETTEAFTTSRTTGQTPGRHFVNDTDWYDRVSERIFLEAFGPVQNCVFFAMLPNYQQNPNSSLIHMVQHFMHQSAGGRFMDDENVKGLESGMGQAAARGLTPVLFGVTFALLELEKHGVVIEPPCLLIETGGMKGRGKEITRTELHERLAKVLSNADIRSEYGMTELLSQAYTKQNTGTLFTPGFTMRANLRDVRDPLTPLPYGRGALNIIDLANVDSCSFIATEDLAEMKMGSPAFSIVGRVDASEIRGCNLMAG